ncbi:hypothetical protein KCU72_g24701, partial [Aureobasidium melanogenum]
VGYEHAHQLSTLVSYIHHDRPTLLIVPHYHYANQPHRPYQPPPSHAKKIEIMDGAHASQRPGDFYSQKPRTPEPETPTVGPLRIHKVNHSTSTTSTTSTPSRTSSEEAEVDGTSQTRRASPPYPDDRFRPLHAAAGAQRLGTPEVNSSGMRRQSSTRAKFGASDPNR